jgi:hypothetical protein
MIKKYFEFSQYGNHNTLGEYIESLCNDEFIKSIVGEYTKEMDPQIRVSNSVNLLGDYEKIQLLKRIESHLNGSDSEPQITASVDVGEEIDESYGKGIFTTFLKCLTALGLKDNQPIKETPDNFLILFKFEKLDYLKVESVFKRFKSLQILDIQYTPDMGLYFGIKINGFLEYGYIDDKMNKVGEFPLKKSTLNWIKISDLKSLSGIKKSLTDLSYNDIILLGKIKSEMGKFKPDYFEQKMTPHVQDKMIVFGYYGYGNWNMGKLNDTDLIKIKESVKEYLSNYRWSSNVLVNITPSKFWTYIKIKIK